MMKPTAAPISDVAQTLELRAYRDPARYLLILSALNLLGPGGPRYIQAHLGRDAKAAWLKRKLGDQGFRVQETNPGAGDVILVVKAD